MLKDLEKRQDEHSLPNDKVIVPVNTNNASYKNITLIVITIVLTLLAVYLWQLQGENQRLKNQKIALSSQATPASISKTPTQEKVAISQNNENIRSENLAPTTKFSQEKPPKPSVDDEPRERIIQAEKVEQHSYVEESSLPTSAVEIKGETTASIKETPQNGTKYNGTKHNASVKVTALTKSKPINDSISDLPTANKSNQNTSSSMVISRKQLTPEVLAAQKMRRAKEAVANNDIGKAEKLFEDVLLVLPSEKDARKQLAALWFGRQSYQSAINLLAQGIRLDPSDKELRILQAQIFIKQNLHLPAFQVLQSLPNIATLKDNRYQSMLATQAQASKQFAYAISAYQRLTVAQPEIGRGWLGLAIAYDSNSQFQLASTNYTAALSKSDLSSSARAFAINRLQELGE